MNYARLGDFLYFHTSPKGALPQRLGGPACFTAQDTLGWIPSYWRHPEMACPATTYYRSVVVRGELEEVNRVEDKALALQAFMERYQREGKYLDFLANLDRYRGSLEALSVMRLPLQDVACKVKFGQHLNGEQRARVYENLLLRRASGDLQVAAAMRLCNPDLRAAGGWTTNPLEIDSEQIWDLLRPTYWGHRRTAELAREHRDQATYVSALVREGRLLAYARLNQTDARSGFLYDVIVHPEERGKGLGIQLMERILEQASELERIFLDTRDADGLYEKFGFRTIDRAPTTGSLFMVRYRPG